MAKSAPQLHEPGDAKEEDLLELQVVRDPSLGGRPLFLTPKRFIRICRWIEQGESVVASCRYESITYTGFRKHVHRNPAYARRLKEAEATRDDFLREFHIENVRKHAPRNLLASLWWLERRFPGDYALRKVDREGTADPLIGEKISEEDVIRYAKVMAEEAKKLCA